ncbi:enoyl-CoA hydratase/isomerase family protein [Amycolatopsis ultiminotia]|uniref:Enoyl-CoA hydratase/isomerase family protein n=1 Tax=Amycolatopsis ultiminotia TaxID=543629 RepID=A0ABP6V1T7_9PSEU
MTTSGAPRLIDPVELARGGAAPMLDEAGRIREPLVFVDLDCGADLADIARAAAVAATGERVLVGVAARHPPRSGMRQLVAELDVSLVPGGAAETPARELVGVADPIAEATAMSALAMANPQAVTVLAGLLRWSGRLSVPAGLDAESLAYSTLLGGAEFRRWLDRRGRRPRPPRAEADPVLAHRDGALLRITLNRPERRNAYGREVRDGLVEALRIAVHDPTVEHILLDGSGRSFSSGGDLDEFGTAPDTATAHFVRTRAGAGHLLHRLADRVEARLHGPCVGAGIELPGFAGRVTATPDATFRLPEIAMGLIPGAGGTVSIPRRIGRWRTFYLSVAGLPLGAQDALAWGLVDSLEARSAARGRTA